MATLLLFVIFIAFIGLGIPDSLFGTAWPAIYPEFGSPVSAASAVTLLISCCTVIASLLSARAINRFGTGTVTAVSTALTAGALLGYSLSGSLLWLCLFAVPLGIGAGAVDAALNNYVALHYRATHMNFLHCFYGVGVSLSPYLMSLFLNGPGGWREGYRTVFYIQLAIAVITLLALPLWGRVRKVSSVAEQTPAKPVKLSELAKMPTVRLVWLVFIGSCAVEFTCGTWGSTFLVSGRGMTVENAAKAITFYYIGMACGRFLSGLLANKLSSWRLIQIGQGIVLAAIASLLFPLPAVLSAAGLFLIGLGNGPVYPNLVHLTPQNFGKELSQSVMGTQMAAASMGIMVLPPAFGLLAQAVGVRLFPVYLLLLFGVMAASTLALIRTLKKQDRYHPADRDTAT